MTETTPLARAFELQSGACAAFGSPFSAALLQRAAADIAAGGPIVPLLAPWADADTRAVIADATSLRWLGAVHDLALSGEAPAISAAWPAPGAPGDADAAWTAASRAMEDQAGHFIEVLSHEPQTNEVRRSACLLPGFLTIARATGLPLRIFEVGASAGLNQLWDRYGYDYGPAGSWGPDGSGVRLDAAWRGGRAPLDSAVAVASRAACDRKPVDIRDPAARRRLKAFVWADQFDRLARIDAALTMALAADVAVERADAVTWTAARAIPAKGAATVLVHSVFWQYMPADSQAAMTAVVSDLGAKATPAAPFAWLRMEPPPGEPAQMELRLTLWPGGEDRRLALVHPHGAWVEWELG